MCLAALSQLLKILAFDRKVTECAEAGGWAISSTRKKDKAVCLYQFINEKLKLRDVKMHEERDDPDPGRTDKKYQIPVIEREVTFTLDDGTKIKRYVRSLDSVPIHNYNGLWPHTSKEETISKCIAEIFNILKEEKVAMLADLLDKVVHDLNIIPYFTYKEIGIQMEKDGRFEVKNMQVCSLKGTDPIELIIEKLDI